ncbi:MAG TPA: hypothetical protein VGM86_10990 [Thermoanaerobaculia bacterium]
MIFEVRAKHHTTPQWAAEYRRNLLRREEFRPTQYFAIVTPDQLYLWREPKPQTDVVLPDFVVDSRPLFLPYLQKTSVDLDRISPFVFELVVISWLSDLVYARREAEGLEPGQAWLMDSGFLDATRDGRLFYDHAA